MSAAELKDYDNLFKVYFDKWLSANRSKYEKVEEIEKIIPEIYAEWAGDTMKDFDGFTGEEFIDLFKKYYDDKKEVPDLLCSAIIENKAKTEKELYKLYRNNMYGEDMQVLIINLFSDMESQLPVLDFLNILSAAKEDNGIVNAASDAVYNMGKDFVEDMFSAYEKSQSCVGRELIMNAIIKYSKNEKIYPLLSKLFKESSNKAFIAALMGEYGDERCLEDLYKAEKSEDINFIDYLEICNAIEALGGETERNREFSNDPYYKYLSVEENG